MDVSWVRSRALEVNPMVRHGFSTRWGGVSTGARSSLHLAVRDGDVAADVVENWRRALVGLAPDVDRLVLLTQVHGARVVVAEEATGPRGTLGEADGVVTTVPGLVLAVRTADCVPVLFAAPGGVGAAHAGWRGLVAGVLQETVERLCEATGCAPSEIQAAVGPHAGPAAYEVGDEVVAALVSVGLERERVSQAGSRGRDHAKLGAAARDLLAAAGVTRVDDVGLCTIDDPRFFSHRRDGAGTGRQAGVIVRVPE